MSPWSDSTSKRPQIDGPQWHVLQRFLLVFLATSNTFSFGCRFRGSSVEVSLCSAICSYMTNTPTAKTFFVGSAFSSTFGVALVDSYRGLVKTFLPFLVSKRYKSLSSPSTCSSLLASLLLASSSKICHHHWSRATSATVDDCHDVCPHLCVFKNQVLLCCSALSQDQWDTWREE